MKENKIFDYIDFPYGELSDYFERIKLNNIIYTTRVSKEVGKYELNNVYNSHFGKLKVISVIHLMNLNDHPFIRELNINQKKEINLYIKECGYDVIGLILIN